MWTEICERLRRGEPLAVATIAMEDGSTPRSAGSKMLAGADGLLRGTVGGGLGEAMALEAAAAVLADGKIRTVPIDMSGSVDTGADLVCGGKLDIVVQRLDRASLETLETLRRRLADGLDSYLATPLGHTAQPVLLSPEGQTLSGLLPAGVAAAIAEEPPANAGVVAVGADEYFVESVRSRVRLVLAGGGHVSRATARMAALIDFDVYVLEDRAEFVAPSRFPWLPGENLSTAPAFSDCLEPGRIGGPADSRCFIAILTRGHAFDYDVLAQALRTRAGYIGMIGSRRKRAQIDGKLLADGFSAKDLERVHSPIGLDIRAETPEEIAVSIVAELIAARAAVHG